MFDKSKTSTSSSAIGNVSVNPAPLDLEVGASLGANARSYGSKASLTDVEFLRLLMSLTTATVAAGGAATALTPTPAIAAVSIGLAWNTAPGADSYTIYAGTLRPGADTNDITALTGIGSVSVAGGDTSNATFLIGPAGLGTSLGFYAVANYDNEGISIPSNVATVILNSTNYAAYRVTNAVQIAASRVNPMSLLAVNGVAPEITLAIQAIDANQLMLQIQGLRPGENYVVEKASPLTSSWSAVLTNSASFTNLTEEVIFPMSGTSGFFRAKRVP